MAEPLFQDDGGNPLAGNENPGIKNKQHRNLANNYLTLDTKLLYLSAPTPEIPNLSLYEAWMKLSLPLRKEQSRNHPCDGPSAQVPATEYTEEHIERPILMTLRIEGQITS